MTSIILPDEDLQKTIELLKAIYPEKHAELDALLPIVICNQLYAYRREMITNHTKERLTNELG